MFKLVVTIMVAIAVCTVAVPSLAQTTPLSFAIHLPLIISAEPFGITSSEEPNQIVLTQEEYDRIVMGASLSGVYGFCKNLFGGSACKQSIEDIDAHLVTAEEMRESVSQLQSFIDSAYDGVPGFNYDGIDDAFD